MASTRTRRNGSIQVLFRHRGKQTSETFQPGEEKAALDFKADIEKYGPDLAVEMRDRAAGRDVATRAPTLVEHLRSHAESLPHITEGTRRDYLAYARQMEDNRIGRIPVDMLERDDVKRWIVELRKKYAEKSIKNRHAFVSSALTAAVEEGIIMTNVARGMGIPRTERREDTYLTHNEFAILYGHIPARYQPLVATLAGTGLRWGEATALQVQDVHLDDTPPTLSVNRAWKHTDGAAPELGPPKTKRGRRTIGLPPALVLVLTPLVADREAKAFLFTNKDGNAVRHHSFHELWQKAIREAQRKVDDEGNEIPPSLRLTKTPRIHDLRHSHASWLIAQGVNLQTIQYRLGHESISTTSDIYGHLQHEQILIAAEASAVGLAQALPELEESE